MVSRLFSLIGLWLLSFSVMAENNQDLIKNLRTRLHPLPNDKGELIQSYPTSKQSYIYDQALAIIAFTKEDDRFAAQSLLRGLESLQLPDGSLYFSYYINGESPYPIEGDKRYAGAIAWTAIAANHYQNKFKSDEFVDFNIRVLNYLSKQMVPIQVRGQKTLALKFGPSDIKATGWREDETAALEHNLDAYSAFKHFNELNSAPIYKKETTALKGFILSMWDKERSHFWSGANIKSGEINQGELYLDNQTWSLLVLDTKTVNELNFKEALDLNCESFYVEHEGIMGFMDSKPTRRPASVQFIWSEGTLGQVLAMKKFEETSKHRFTCKKLTFDDILQSVLKMKKLDGGVAYATKSSNTDFTTASSVAGTTWMYFALMGINPFDLDEEKRIKSPAPSISLHTR
jgi:hypothetical protein